MDFCLKFMKISELLLNVIRMNIKQSFSYETYHSIHFPFEMNSHFSVKNKKNI